jgi:hypothetical protein
MNKIFFMICIIVLVIGMIFTGGCAGDSEGQESGCGGCQGCQSCGGNSDDSSEDDLDSTNRA